MAYTQKSSVGSDTAAAGQRGQAGSCPSSHLGPA